MSQELKDLTEFWGYHERRIEINNIAVGLAAAEMGEETGMIPEQYL